MLYPVASLCKEQLLSTAFFLPLPGPLYYQIGQQGGPLPMNLGSKRSGQQKKALLNGCTLQGVTTKHSILSSMLFCAPSGGEREKGPLQLCMCTLLFVPAAVVAAIAVMPHSYKCPSACAGVPSRKKILTSELLSDVKPSSCTPMSAVCQSSLPFPKINHSNFQCQAFPLPNMRYATDFFNLKVGF